MKPSSFFIAYFSLSIRCSSMSNAQSIEFPSSFPTVDPSHSQSSSPTVISSSAVTISSTMLSTNDSIVPNPDTVVYPIYTQQGTCSTNQVSGFPCSISCTNGRIYNLQNPATVSGLGTQQNYFQQYENSQLYPGVQFNYAWAIPICGTSPSNSAVTPSGCVSINFATSTVWQWGSCGTAAIYLGLYTTSGWSFGNLVPPSSPTMAPASAPSVLNPNFALSFRLQPGASIYCPNNIQRQTTVYLQCNQNYLVSAPFLEVVEISTCNCKFQD